MTFIFDHEIEFTVQSTATNVSSIYHATMKENKKILQTISHSTNVLPWALCIFKTQTQNDKSTIPENASIVENQRKRMLKSITLIIYLYV